MYQLLDSNSIKHVFVRRTYDFGERVFGNVYYWPVIRAIFEP